MPSKTVKSTQKHFYGTATLGEKGQIVIPKAAREDLGLKQGDHLLVLGLHHDLLALAKPTQVEELVAHFSNMRIKK